MTQASRLQAEFAGIAKIAVSKTVQEAKAGDAIQPSRCSWNANDENSRIEVELWYCHA
jgi:hypothetical protein